MSSYKQGDLLEGKEKKAAEKIAKELFAPLKRMCEKPHLPQFFRVGHDVVDMYGRHFAKCTNDKDADFIVEAVEYFIKSKETSK